MYNCLVCGKELLESEKEICDSCYPVLKTKYAKTKFQEVLKCHRKNARRLKK